MWRTTALKGHEKDSGTVDSGAGNMQPARHDRATVVRAWVPWIVLSVFVFLWGVPQVRGFLNGSYAVTKVEQTATGPVKTEEKKVYPWNGVTKLDFKVVGLNELVEKVPPVVAKAHTEKAVYSLNWLSATGSGILLAALLAGLYMRYSFGELLRKYWETSDAGEILPADHRCDAGSRVHHPVLRNRCDDGPGVRLHRRDVSVLRHHARLARGGAHRAPIPRRTCCSADCRKSLPSSWA